MQRLTGKVAWVTGAGTGIGEAAAIALAREGASVMLTGRRKEPLEMVAARVAEEGGTARVHSGDMSHAEDALGIAEAIEREFGRIDILSIMRGPTCVGLKPTPAVADVADEPLRNRRLLPVKRADGCTAEVGGSNPLRSTRKEPLQ
jgi:NAD(P)-dependent dehydrogenase (short-subunit alcohol dehydrogenase family)